MKKAYILAFLMVIVFVLYGCENVAGDVDPGVLKLEQEGKGALLPSVHAEDSKTMLEEDIPNAEKPVWDQQLQEMLQSKYKGKYKGLTVHLLDSNHVLAGVYIDRVPTPAIKQTGYWYLIKQNVREIIPIEGQYERLLEYDNGEVTAFCDGHFGDFGYRVFPFLFKCDVEMGETWQEPYYAPLTDSPQYILGGVGAEYSLYKIESTDSEVRLLMKAVEPVITLRLPEIYIYNSSDTVLLNLYHVTDDRNKTNECNIAVHQLSSESDEKITSIAIPVNRFKEYTCLFEPIDDEYMTVIIKFQ